LLKLAFGIYGPRIQTFAQKVNYQNPLIHSVLDGELTSVKTGSFNSEIQDYLRLVVYAKSWKMSSLIKDNLKRLISRHPAWHKIKKLSVKQFARLFKHEEDRQDARNRNPYQVVDLDAFAKNKDAYWKQELDFTAYYRFQKNIEKDNNLKQKLELFTDKGFIGVANLVKKELAIFEKKDKEKDYFGFKKITATKAAILIARINDFELKEISSKNIFLTLTTSTASDLVVSKTIQKNNKTFFPIMYNYNKLSEVANSVCVETVALCENFPSNNNTPIFDNYKVLVPSILMPYSENNSEKLEIISKLKRKDIVGVLLGEKDNILYFLNYFS